MPREAALPDIVAVPPTMLANPDWDHELVDDLRAPADQTQARRRQAGYRSVLRLAIRLDERYVAGLSFLSSTPGQYRAADVPVARRIADRMALSFARDAERRADQARRRGDRSGRPARSAASARSPTSSTRAPAIAA